MLKLNAIMQLSRLLDPFSEQMIHHCPFLQHPLTMPELASYTNDNNVYHKLCSYIAVFS